MSAGLMDAFLARDTATVARLVDYRTPTDLSAEALELVRWRREQLERDPARLPWSLRAIVRRADRVMIGYTNFHGPPGINDTGTKDAAELGWTIFAEHRRQGYATETAKALMDWAAREHGVRHFISSTTADNRASLRVHDKLGFRRTGQIVDGEIIFELRRA